MHCKLEVKAGSLAGWPNSNYEKMHQLYIKHPAGVRVPSWGQSAAHLCEDLYQNQAEDELHTQLLPLRQILLLPLAGRRGGVRGVPREAGGHTERRGERGEGEDRKGDQCLRQ